MLLDINLSGILISNLLFNLLKIMYHLETITELISYSWFLFDAKPFSFSLQLMANLAISYSFLNAFYFATSKILRAPLRLCCCFNSKWFRADLSLRTTHKLDCSLILYSIQFKHAKFINSKLFVLVRCCYFAFSIHFEF